MECSNNENDIKEFFTSLLSKKRHEDVQESKLKGSTTDNRTDTPKNPNPILATSVKKATSRSHSSDSDSDSEPPWLAAPSLNINRKLSSLSLDQTKPLASSSLASSPAFNSVKESSQFPEFENLRHLLGPRNQRSSSRSSDSVSDIKPPWLVTTQELKPHNHG